MSDWQKNPGYLPEELRGTGARVKVRLRNGKMPEESWPAEGKGGLNWNLRRFPFDVLEYKIAR